MPNSNKGEDTAEKTPPTTVAIVRQGDDDTGERSRRIALVLFGAAAIMVAATIFWVIFLLTTKYTDQSDQVNKLAAANVELQDQNRVLQRSIDNLTTQTENERATDDCFAIYTNLITEAASRFQTQGSGRILIMIVGRLFNDPSLPPEQRTPTQQEFEEAVVEAKRLETVYNDAIKARQTWIKQGSPTPCPITPAPLDSMFPTG